MASPQPGIFALGSQAHAYLEYDLTLWAEPGDLVSMASRLCVRDGVVGNPSLVCGFRPELWAAADPAKAPHHTRAFIDAVVGDDGYTMPATQHDLVLWAAAGTIPGVFDTARSLTGALRRTATLAEETSGWTHREDLDLTGFINGTRNPPLSLAAAVLIPDNAAGAGGTVMLLQKWEHDADAWAKLPVSEQEKVVGRTKLDSVELAVRPDTSHRARTDQDQLGYVLRRSTAYGTVRNHGTMFVGFSADQRRLHSMLESMAGLRGPRDALTRYARALTGAYYFIPSIDDLADNVRNGHGARPSS
jgi:putative iron-dependent peroxidase